MVYALVLSNLVLLSTRNHGVISTRSRSLRIPRDCVEIKPYLRVDANVGFGFTSVQDMQPRCPERPGLRRGAQMVENGALWRAVMNRARWLRCRHGPTERLCATGRHSRPFERLCANPGAPDISATFSARSFSPIWYYYHLVRVRLSPAISHSDQHVTRKVEIAGDH